MTNEARNDAGNEAGREPESETAAAQPGTMRALLSVPGVAAVSLYMMVLAGINAVGVVAGQIRPAYLVLSAVFIAAGLGLLMLLRWAWAMTLAAVVLFAALSVWRFSITHQPPAIFQGLLNLVFFLYLLRIEVREKLR